MKLFTKNAVMAAVGLSLAGAAGAYDVQSNTAKSIIWRYHNCTMDTTTGSTGDDGSAYYSANQNSGRIPTTGPAAACYATNFNTLQNPLTAPAELDLLTPRIAATLIETKNVNAKIPLTGDDQTNIYVKAGTEVDVWVTFMTEGATYRNSVGFFTWSGNALNKPNALKPVRDVDGLPKLADGSVLNSERIVFPDASSNPVTIPNSDKSGTTVYLGKFNGGQHGLGIGFMVAANAWSSTGRGTSPNRNGTSPNHNKDNIFYSIRGMNPECYLATCTGDFLFRDQHTIMLYDEQVTGPVSGNKYRRMILGMEDQYRTGGDHDFNDVLLAVHVKESTAGAFENLAGIPKLLPATSADSDGDSVPDSVDEFPNDASRAFSRYFPGKTSWGTLAYEDLWPATGDYDFNDLLMRYRSREIMDKDRKVVALEMDFRLAATGAGHVNGFALNLPAVARSAIDVSAGKAPTLTGKYYDLTGERTISANPFLAITGGQNGSVFEIFKNAKVLLESDNGSAGLSARNSPYDNASCIEKGFRNTGKACGASPAAEFKLTVNFKNAINSSNFPTPPYDPFLFRADTTPNSGVEGNVIEVHLPGKGPTARADKSFFGTRNDRTPKTLKETTTNATELAQSYLSNTKLPWAIHIPVEWNYPYEKLDFTVAYPDVVNWANSGGTTNTTWFSRPALDGEYTFKKHAK
ncbi:MAG: hypothetical protein RLZZ352_2783 [Pseudomonadota bacterium]|jgi:LruC domain-containing protein